MHRLEACRPVKCIRALIEWGKKICNFYFVGRRRVLLVKVSSLSVIRTVADCLCVSRDKSQSLKSGLWAAINSAVFGWETKRYQIELWPLSQDSLFQSFSPLLYRGGKWRSGWREYELLARKVTLLSRPSCILKFTTTQWSFLFPRYKVAEA